MAFIGRYTKYPTYPDFGSDPTKFNNALSITIEQDLFTVGQVLNLQVKIGSTDIRIYDQIVEFYNGDVDFTILESPTLTDGVTPVPIGNADRNSTFVSSVTAYSDPTGISGGTPLRGMEHFGVPSPIIGFGDVPPTTVNFLTLKLNTNYIIRFANVGTENIIDFRYLLLFAE